MSINITVNQYVFLNRPQAVVFKAVTDWDSQRIWIPLTTVKPRSIRANQEGHEIEAFTGIGSLGFLDTMTITKWEYPELCEVIHTGKVIKGTGTFKVTAENSGSRFTWAETTPLPFGILGLVLWPFAWLTSKFSLTVSLYLFKKRLDKILEAV